MEFTKEKPLFFVCGATGTGKSSLALKLAVHLKLSYGYSEVVIINCDVMQFYKDLPIATNKVSDGEVQGIPNLFLGFLNADDSYSTMPEADFYGNCNFIVTDCHSRDSPDNATRFTIHAYLERVTQFITRFFNENSKGAVIVCGGTCYYLQSILFENMLVPEGRLCDDTKDFPFAQGDEAEIKEQDLWKTLNEIDPATAQRYHPNDSRRLRRLLEIFRESGSPPSDVFDSRDVKLRFPPERTYVVWTWIDREVLNNRLRERVDEMVRQGLLSEIKEFRCRTLPLGKLGAISEAIGFKEFDKVPIEALCVEGDIRVSEALEAVKRDTIQYARKQERWLKNRINVLLSGATPSLPPSRFLRVDMRSERPTDEIVKEVAKVFLTDSPSCSACISYPLAAMEKPKEPVTQEYCEVCETVVCGRGQMEAHLSSKRHRGAVRRKKLELEQLERFGRVIPPRKRQRES